MSISDQYMKKVFKNVPLDELYEVVDYLCWNDQQKVCPVLLKVKIPELVNDDEVDE